MAIEVFPDSPTAGMSPRISFSQDLSQNDDVPVEQYLHSPSSATAVDFDFCVFRESFDQDYSSADELFLDGKILPIEIKRRLPPPPPPPPRTRPRPCYIPPPPPQLQKTSADREIEEEKQSKASSFWSFKRSTSLNCGNGYARTLCPLTLLSRSNSIGSTSSSVKRSNSIPHNQKQSLAKNSQLKQTSSSNHQKPPLRKNIHGSYSNGVKINPVLNIPSANLFGLGSIFSGGKDRSKKK